MSLGIRHPPFPTFFLTIILTRGPDDAHTFSCIVRHGRHGHMPRMNFRSILQSCLCQYVKDLEQFKIRNSQFKIGNPDEPLLWRITDSNR